MPTSQSLHRDRHPAVIAVDIDGVLALPAAPPDQAGWQRSHVTLADRTGTTWINPAHRDWLAELAARGAHLVLASAGGAPAAQALTATLGLPSLPCLPLQPAGEPIRFGHTVKLRPLLDYAAGAPLVLLDDTLGGKDPHWAAQRTTEGTPTLLHEINGQQGLTRGDLCAVHTFLDTLPDPRLRGRAPLVSAPLTGHDGNIYAVLGRATRPLRHHGYRADADQMAERVFAAGSYDQALGIITDYVADAGPDADPTGDRLPPRR